MKVQEAVQDRFPFLYWKTQFNAHQYMYRLNLNYSHVSHQIQHKDLYRKRTEFEKGAYLESIYELSTFAQTTMFCQIIGKSHAVYLNCMTSTSVLLSHGQICLEKNSTNQLFYMTMTSFQVKIRPHLALKLAIIVSLKRKNNCLIRYFQH